MKDYFEEQERHGQREYEQAKERLGRITKWMAVSIGILFGLILIFSSFTIVSAGHTGVVVTFGKVSGSMTEGLHLKWPVAQKIVMMDNRILKLETQNDSVSKDLQSVSATVALNHRLLPDKSAVLYQGIGVGYEDVVIQPSLQECIKAVSARYTAEELITNRGIVSTEISDLLKTKISQHGIHVQDFNIVNFSFSKEFDAAIEAKQVAQQNALKAEQDLARIKIEAEQRVAQAQAEAEAYRLQSQQLTDNMISAKWIEKWDGTLPTVMGGDSGSVILDMRKENAK